MPSKELLIDTNLPTSRLLRLEVRIANEVGEETEALSEGGILDSGAEGRAELGCSLINSPCAADTSGRGVIEVAVLVMTNTCEQ